MKVKKIRAGFQPEEYLLLAQQFSLLQKVPGEKSQNVIHWKRRYDVYHSRLWFNPTNLPDDLKNKDFYEHLVFARVNGHLAAYYLLSVEIKSIGLKKINTKKTDKLIGGYADFWDQDDPDLLKVVFQPVANTLNNGSDVFSRIIGDYKIAPSSPYEQYNNFVGKIDLDFDDLRSMPGDEGEELDEYSEFINRTAVQPAEIG